MGIINFYFVYWGQYSFPRKVCCYYSITGCCNIIMFLVSFKEVRMWDEDRIAYLYFWSYQRNEETRLVKDFLFKSQEWKDSQLHHKW